MYKLISSEDYIYIYMCVLLSVRVSPATSHTTYAPSQIYIHPPFSYPTAYPYRWILLSSSPPPFYSHTPIHCFLPLPSSHPTHLLFSLSLSLLPALCVLLRRSNFPFDFGGNAFFTNQRGSQAAPPSSSSSPSLLHFFPSLPPQSLVLAPLGPPGQRGDKGAPIISLLVLIWAAQGFQVPPITPRNIITSSPGNTVPHTHTLTHTCMHRLSDTDTHR